MACGTNLYDGFAYSGPLCSNENEKGQLLYQTRKSTLVMAVMNQSLTMNDVGVTESSVLNIMMQMTFLL